MKGGDLQKLLRTAKVCIMALKKGVTLECQLMSWNWNTIIVQLPQCKLNRKCFLHHEKHHVLFWGVFHVNYTSFRYFLTSPCVNLRSAGSEKRIVTDFFLSNYYIWITIFLTGIYWPGLSVWRTCTTRSYLTRMCFHQSRSMTFLSLLPSCITVNFISPPSPPPPPRYKQPSCMYLTEFDFYDVFKLKKVSQLKKYFNQHCYRQ